MGELRRRLSSPRWGPNTAIFNGCAYAIASDRGVKNYRKIRNETEKSKTGGPVPVPIPGKIIFWNQKIGKLKNREPRTRFWYPVKLYILFYFMFSLGTLIHNTLWPLHSAPSTHIFLFFILSLSGTHGYSHAHTSSFYLNPPLILSFPFSMHSINIHNRALILILSLLFFSFPFSQ